LTLALFVVPLATTHSNGAGGLNTWSATLYTPLGSSFFDQFYGSSQPAVVQGGSMNVVVTFTPSNSCPKVGCNMSIGIAFDTLANYTQSASGYTNASNARPNDTFTALPGQPYTVSFSVKAPATANYLITHQYQVDFVNLAKANTSSSSQTILGTTNSRIAIISTPQQTYWFANKNLTNLESAYSGLLAAALSSPNGYQYSNVASELAQQTVTQSKASTQYSEGLFTQANSTEVLALSQYQQAVSSYQSGASALTNQNNTYQSLVPYGAILLGVGALIAGIGLALGALRRSS
jgi:hypothetical protein